MRRYLVAIRVRPAESVERLVELSPRARRPCLDERAKKRGVNLNKAGPQVQRSVECKTPAKHKLQRVAVPAARSYGNVLCAPFECLDAELEVIAATVRTD